MLLTMRESWVAIHGIVFGAIFLLAFSGVLVALFSLRPRWLTAEGMSKTLRWSKLGTSVMAVMAWLTVISGTYIVYPWYRATPPEGADLSDFPRYLLLSIPELSAWHTFGMEWKEHIAWFAPILSTAVAFIVWQAGNQMAENTRLRNGVAVLLIMAFAAAGVAGLFGAFITKAAPVV